MSEMERYVTSLELSKKLPGEEFGDCQWWWQEGHDGQVELVKQDNISRFNHYPAPLTDEWLERLPHEITNIERDIYTLTILKWNTRPLYYVGYVDQSRQKTLHRLTDKRLPDALAKMYLYLKKEGLIK